MEYYSIVLSAGKGTRMYSEKPKVIHELIDTPMISLVLEELTCAGVTKNNVVVGYKKEEVLNTIIKKFPDVSHVEQKEQLGTGHAVLQLKEKMKNKKGITIITCGDTPLVTSDIFKQLIENHIEQKNNITVLSTKVENPFGYGRIIRDQMNNVMKIVEEKDAQAEEKKINEINSGIYCVDNQLLFENIDKISNDNSQKEYYITDLISIFLSQNLKVGACITFDNESLIGINDLYTLEKATQIFKERINDKHLKNGVKIVDKNNTYIGKDVEIGMGTVIYPNNHLTGKIKIGKNNLLKSGNVIENVIIGDDNQIGPMAYLREETHIHSQNRVGCFVELKKTNFGEGSKVAHLTYLGDTEIGTNSNIGCGVISANYDGQKKAKTIIGNNVFLGSNVNLIAPVVINNNSFIAAGTTVDKNVEEDSFVIGRVRQTSKNKK